MTSFHNIRWLGYGGGWLATQWKQRRFIFMGFQRDQMVNIEPILSQVGIFGYSGKLPIDPLTPMTRSPISNCLSFVHFGTDKSEISMM